MLAIWVITHSLSVSPPATTATQGFEQQVLNLVNQERTNRGLPPLVSHYMLESAADAHSLDLGIHGVCQHESTDGTPWDTRIRRHGYTPAYVLAENVACGQTTPQQVVRAWMNSDEGHRGNILGDFQHVGVGYFYNDTVEFQHFWTLDLGKPAPDTPPPQPPPGPCSLQHDFNHNGVIGTDDIDLLEQLWQDDNRYDPTYDVNTDRKINVVDAMIVLLEWGMTCE
jgi:hypothetical protein